MRRDWQAAAVAGLAVVAFVSAIGNGPLEDDLPLLHQRLAAVHSVADLPRLLGQSYWGDLYAGGLWRPLTLVTLGAERLAFGDRLWAYRAVSLALHAACTLLVLRLARLALAGDADADGDRDDDYNAAPAKPAASWPPFLAAILFAAHPSHAEAVITIYGQADLWAALFALAALCIGLDRRGGGGSSRAVGVAGMLLLSLGFKEAAIALPLALWVLRRGPSSSSLPSWRPDAVTLTAAATWAIYLPLRWVVLGHDWTPPVTVGGGGAGGRLVTVAVALATDLRLLILPWGQTMYYGHLRDRLAAGGTAELLALIAIVWGATWVWQNGGRGARIGLVLLAVFLLPVAQFVPIGALVAERTLYLPSVGFVLVSMAMLPREMPGRPVGIFVGATLLIVIAVGLCWRVSGQWRDERTAWETTLADHPLSARAAAEVVRLRLDDPAFADSPTARGDLHRLLDAAEAISPESARIFIIKAKFAAIEGDVDSARRFAETAARLDPAAP